MMQLQPVHWPRPDRVDLLGGRPIDRDPDHVRIASADGASIGAGLEQNLQERVEINGGAW